MFAIGYGLAGLPVSRLVGKDLTLQDNFTQVKGRHTIKAGYEMVRTRVDSVLPSLPSGTYNFGGTELPFTPNTGNTFASFLLGTVSSASFTNTYASCWLPRWWQHALYVQDDWKIARGLTLNFGLRWSHESPFPTKYGQAAQFDPTGVDPLTGLKGAITHNPGPLAKGDWNNFQPRLGLAWHLRPKWVFRSSFGIMTQDGYRTAYNQNFQEYVGTANVQQLPGNPSHVFLLSQGPPAVNYALQSNGTVPYLGTNYSARAADWYDPNMHAPYIMMWSGGFQYQFARDWLVETLYEGSAGVGLLENWNINQIPLDVSTNPAVLGQIFRATQNYLPYPQFGTINLFSNFGHNTHHAATLRVEKRYAVGLTVLETYTFQKTMDDCDVDGACTGVSYYNRSLEKARAGYDITHHFLHMMTYDLPFGKGRRWLNRGGFLNRVVGEWNGAWTTTLESGPPTSLTFAGSPNQYLPQGVYRPNALAPDYVTSSWEMGPNRFPTSAQNPYLNVGAFTYPAAFTVGTLGRNTYEAPGMVWMQFSLFKTFSIGERFKFTLRADGNNFPFKHWQLTAPNAVYNTSSPLTFGRFSSERGTYAGIGNSRPHVVLGARIDF